MKKFFALLLAAVMVFSFTAVAFADGETPEDPTHTITIRNKDDGHTYEAYQIFSGSITDGKLVDIEWGSGVDGEALLEALTKLDAYKDCKDANDVAKALSGLGSSPEAVDAFAALAGEHLKDAAGTSEEVMTTGTDPVFDGAYTIDVKGDGYYLIKDKDGSVAADEAYTKYILNVVDDVKIDAKADYPTIDKAIVEDGSKVDTNNASIGDKVSYEVTSKVPNMDGYNKYYFIVTDTMSSGLKFNDDFTVTIGGKTLEPDELNENGTVKTEKDFYYTLTENADGSTSIKLVIRNFIGYKDQAGDDVVISYSATVDDDAVIGTDPNPNSVDLTFSNDPNYDYGGETTPGEDTPPDEPGKDEPVGKTPKSTVYTYVTGIKVAKIDESGNELTGAQFQIKGDALNRTIVTGAKYEKSDYELAEGESAADSNTYYKLVNGSYTTTAPTTGVNESSYDSTTQTYIKVNYSYIADTENSVDAVAWVDENGVVTFTGLGEGTYTISELIAPSGYNLLKEPVTVKIEWTAPDDDSTDMKCTWTATNGKGDEYTVENGIVLVSVTNKAGTVLPSTGGIGTTIFYILGGTLAVAAGVLLITKKRMGPKD